MRRECVCGGGEWEACTSGSIADEAGPTSADAIGAAAGVGGAGVGTGTGAAGASAGTGEAGATSAVVAIAGGALVVDGAGVGADVSGAAAGTVTVTVEARTAPADASSVGTSSGELLSGDESLSSGTLANDPTAPRGGPVHSGAWTVGGECVLRPSMGMGREGAREPAREDLDA